MKALPIALAFLLIATPVLAAGPGFLDRLQFLFSGDAEDIGLTPSDTTVAPVCDPCAAVVCGGKDQFLCHDTLARCTATYGASCVALTCDVPKTATCTWSGKTFKEGDTVKIECNDCTCTNGQLACTKKACAACEDRFDCPSMACIRAPCPSYSCIDGYCVLVQPDDDAWCLRDSDCPVLACETAPCATNRCIDGACVTVRPTASCAGVGGACTELGGECCDGLVCDTGIAADDVRGGNFRGTCVQPDSACGDGVCQSWEVETCPPCDPNSELPCTGAACNPDACPQDC